MKIIALNTKSIKKTMKDCGINAMVRKYNALTISVWVDRADIDKAKAYFADLDIKRFCPTNGIKDPFEVNGGEFNSLVAIAR